MAKAERQADERKHPDLFTAPDRAQIQECTQAFADPVYRKQLQMRLIEGRAPHIELFYLQHLYGKPVDKHELSGPEGGAIPTISMSTTETSRPESAFIWRGAIAEFMQDDTRVIDLRAPSVRQDDRRSVEGGAILLSTPGDCLVILRYHGDTQTKLKPVWRAILTLCGVKAQWDAMALCDILPNGLRCYIFGIKAQDQTARYGKLRGLTLAGIQPPDGGTPERHLPGVHGPAVSARVPPPVVPDPQPAG